MNMIIQFHNLYSWVLIFALGLCDKGTNAFSSDVTSLIGHHCVNFTGYADNQSECVSCFFPQNCLTNNTCNEGTRGKTCEHCTFRAENGAQDKYYRLGNACISCEAIPVTTIGFGIYLFLFIIAAITNGFSSSLCTKLKVICHFLQMLYLTFLIKIQWPLLIQKIMMGLAFVTFNSNIIPLKCLIPSLSFLNIHYLEWTSSFLVLIAIAFITILVDKSLTVVFQTETKMELKQKKWHHRIIFLRLMFYVMVVMYMPISLSVVHSSLCSGVVPAEVTLNANENVFFYLQDESCNQIIFQKKWKLLSKVNQQYRPLYESYRHRCCFWEAFPMFRKLISIAVTDTYPLSVFVQCLIQLSTTGVYFILLILLRPYRSVVLGNRKADLHTYFEILSTLTVGLMQALPLLGRHTLILQYAILACTALTLLIGLVMIFLTPFERNDQVSSSEDMLNTPGQSLFRRHIKVAPAPQKFEEETE
ncbi:uncharacterized protein LOC125671451 isoform X2 [Ostrea edulis]|uniref:uncharacterized protein LOC125671451 isoform X2 n=1 Tax=Ostrea edulis TaxID=37623 RepID=UPI0024AF0762|nr:uncharacterized protein LOC125671451 isoform X2 [Ostrea edulis]